MPITNLHPDTLLLAAAVAAVVLLLAIIAPLWAWLSTRGRLRDTREALHHSNQSLAESELAAHGQAVRLDHLDAQLRARHEETARLQEELAALRRDLQEAVRANSALETAQRERAGQHQEQLRLVNEARDNLKREFENLANRIFEDKGKSFTTTSRASLEDLLRPFREQIAGFQQRINEVHTESVRGHTNLEAEIRKVLEIGLEMNSQASNLALALKGDKKATGNWGEAQLERTLELAGLEKGEHYDTQAAFSDEEGRRKVPDFLIRLPDGKSLVIDSKVSLVDYDRAIAAETDEARTEALTAHAQAVRNHIDSLNTKDYGNLPNIGSPDFVLMFMPIEPAYIEAMKHNRDLFDYGYRKNVIMVSHTTLMPILRTVANLWKMDRSNREAQEIGRRAGEIYNQVCLVAERLGKLGASMRTAQGHYNDTLTSLVGKQGLVGKVERFGQLSAKANRDMPALEPVHDDLEDVRLQALNEREEDAPEASGPPASGPPASEKVKSLRAEPEG